VEQQNTAIEWNGCRAGVDPALVQAVERAARVWSAEIGRPVEVASGVRTLRRQAELMAAMSDAQLHGLYSAGGVPDYVRRICELRSPDGTISAARVYDVLRQRHGGYVSRHLFGAAVDLAVPQIAVPELVDALLQQGLAVLDERDRGIHCLHVSLPGAPVRIVRR